jgi:ATP-dependent Clp protease, protease subunit
MDQPKKIFYVNYCDSINDVKVKAIMSVFAEIIAKEKPDTLYILFASGGGNVEPGIALYNYLRALPVEIIMHNTGSVDSIANVIFLSANARFASTHSSFLFHGVNWNFNEKTSMTRSQLAECLSGLDSLEDKISGIVTERSKLTAEEVRTLFRQGESKNASFALNKGIINEIRDPVIPKGAPFFSFNLT